MSPNIWVGAVLRRDIQRLLSGKGVLPAEEIQISKTALVFWHIELLYEQHVLGKVKGFHLFCMHQDSQPAGLEIIRDMTSEMFQRSFSELYGKRVYSEQI